MAMTVKEIREKVKTLPSEIRPRYEQVDDCMFPKSRKDLLYHLWYVEELRCVNMFKEGSRWICSIGGTVHQTGAANLRTYSVQDWVDCIQKKQFPV